MAATPTRKTSEQELDAWNIAMRGSPGYLNYLRSIGKAPGFGLKLSRGEQEGLERVLAGAGIPVPDGMHIDQGGNLNQKNRLGRNVAIGAAITAATLATAGAAGFEPLAGVMGGSTTAAAPGAIAATTGGGTAATMGGTVGALGTLGKIINTGRQIADLASNVNNVVRGGVTPTQSGAVADDRAQQAALNRYRESQLAQGGPAVDAAALTNVLRSGRLANYTPPSATTQAMFDKFGKRLPPVDPTSMAFAKSMQDELARRMAAGEPLTLSGLQKPGVQELADTAAARKAAENPLGTGVTGAINKGAQLANLAPAFGDLLKKFKRPAGGVTPTLEDVPWEPEGTSTNG